jgi:CO/xanthine dehydrogenase Mo-binding subunit
MPALTNAPKLFTMPEVRTDGIPKVTGRTQYAADLVSPNALWADFVQSPHAHAKIVRIDVGAARAMPGVHAVLTADDIGRPHFGRMLFDWPVLAFDTARFVGDRVVMVAAESREEARAAVGAVNVVYEELLAALDIASSLKADAPTLHPHWNRYTRLTPAPPTSIERDHPNIYATRGLFKGEPDLDALFARAHRVFAHDFDTPRTYPGFLEPRATCVWINGSAIHIRSSNKTPFLFRRQFAEVVGVPEKDVIIEPAAIGGDFVGKGLTPDEYPCYYLSRATGRPVAHIATFTEELRRGPTRHRASLRLRSAIDADGHFIAHVSTVFFDGGAYAAAKPMATLLPGSGYGSVPYRVPNVRIELRGVYTNTLPAAHVRAPADFQTFTAWEQHVDLIARELGEDPFAFRIKNVIGDGDSLFTGEVIDRPMAAEVLYTLQREAGTQPAGDTCGRGISLACNHTGSGDTTLRMRLSADGCIRVYSGAVDQGSGVATVISRVVAATLGIRPNRIETERSNTADAAFDAGSGHARVTHIVGRAALDAAERLRRHLEDIRTESSEDFDTLARRLCADGPLEVVGSYVSNNTHQVSGEMGFGGCAIDVYVDKDTGQLFIRNVVLVTDAGTVINPIAHQGQIDGAFIFGLGAALTESVRIDDDGRLSALSLADFKLMCIADIPPLRTVLVQGPQGDGPFGARGIGELFNIGTAAAVLNAVHDAVGVRLQNLPVRSEDIYAALRAASRAEPRCRRERSP